MKLFSFCLIFIFILNVFAQGPGIRNIYIDRATQLFPSTGVVILELNNGIKSTICMESVNITRVAMVACRSMGYVGTVNGGLDAIAIISSRKTTIAKAHFERLACQGTENSLSDCPGYTYKELSSVGFRCRDNNQDLSVNCRNAYNYSRNIPTEGNCSSNVFLTGSQLLTLRYNNENIFFCGARRQFGTNEAKLFCRMLCQSDVSARIIQGINITDLSANITVGGFSNMTCPSNPSSLQDCVNPYPYQRDGCMPTDNIGVSCTVQTPVVDSPPLVICSNNSMTLQWNLTATTIQKEDVSIIFRNVSCLNFSTSNDTQVFNLTVSLNNCNIDAYGDRNYIIYIYTVRRTFPLVNQIKIKDDQSFTPSCIVPRVDRASYGPFSLNPSSITGGTGTTTVPVQLDLFLDQQFIIPITNILNVALSTTIFVRVMLVNPPSQLVLVILNCYVTSGTTQVTIINNRCPVPAYNVKISPISVSAISFSFGKFEIAGASTLRVICDTSKCGLNEIGCQRGC